MNIQDSKQEESFLNSNFKGGKMKIKLLENDKIIEVPAYWKWHLVEGKKVIIDQNKKIIALVIEE